VTFDRATYKKAYRLKNAEKIRASDREYRKRTAVARQEYQRIYMAAHREERRAYMRDWDRRHFAERKAYSRKSNLKKLYGITRRQYDAILLAQGGGCGICGSPPSPTKDFGVDHDHKTGEVRGLLCDKHNLGLGLFDDSPDRLLDAIAYLKKRRQ